MFNPTTNDTYTTIIERIPDPTPLPQCRIIREKPDFLKYFWPNFEVPGKGIESLICPEDCKTPVPEDQVQIKMKNGSSINVPIDALVGLDDIGKILDWANSKKTPKRKITACEIFDGPSSKKSNNLNYGNNMNTAGSGGMSGTCPTNPNNGYYMTQHGPNTIQPMNVREGTCQRLIEQQPSTKIATPVS